MAKICLDAGHGGRDSGAVGFMRVRLQKQQKLIMQEQTFSRVSTATLQRALKHPDMRRLYMRLRIKLQSARIM